MKRYFLLAITAICLISCSRSISIENFEDGLDKCSIEGESFFSLIETSNGNHFLKGSDDDQLSGSITTAEFDISKDYINMLVGGNKPSGWGRAMNSVQLIVDGESVCTVNSISDNPDSLEWVTMDVRNFKGKKGTIKIESAPAQTFGNYRIPRGFISVDQIEQSNKRLSHYYSVYETIVKADAKYLLIPASTKGANSRLSVMVDGVNILGQEQSCSPAISDIDYYIPIDVSKYKGQKIVVKLTGIKDNYTVFNAIKTSDETGNNYQERYRPVVHFSPSFGWTNDPNGMVYVNGEWHLSLQYNPYSTAHSNMHWGLSVSKDLIHWNDQPFVIAPDELGSIFSGSAVVDHNNSAGFGENAVIAIYTNSGSGQVQSIAYSNDGGYNFTKYDNNPVLVDKSQRDFRDPKVSWIGDKWVMALAVGQVIRFYGSKDLKEWELLSEFGEGIGSHNGTWECPDLIKFDYEGREKWVLFVSINPGGPNGGSITQYFIGQFDGKEFVADKLPYPLWVDSGVDNYAGVTYADAPDGRTVFQGWMSNWVYTGSTPTISFRNAMTLPRDLALKSNGKHLILASVPSPEVYAARCEEYSYDNNTSVDEYIIPSILENNEGAYEIDFTVVPDSKGEMSIELYNTQGERVTFNFDLSSNKLVLDRSQSGDVDFHKSFSNSVTVELIPRSEYRFQLFVDKFSTELFINDGDMAFTNCVFPSETYNSFKISSNDKFDVEDVKIYQLK